MRQRMDQPARGWARQRHLPSHPLLASLLQHPAADRADHAGLLGNGDEFAGRDVAQGGVVPPQQCLHAQQAAALGGQARLVVQTQLLALQRAAQLLLHRLAGQRALVGLGRIEQRHVAPRGLGLVHGGVGTAHELVDVAAVLGVDGDAHTARHVQLVPFHRVALADERNQAPLHQLLHILAPGHVAHHHHELVAAQAADRVAAAHGLREAPGHRAQQAVADVVTQRVVDGLEAVQVDEQHSHLLARDRRLRQRHLQTLHAQRTVGQLGEHVVVRQELNALFAALAVGDVDGDADVVGQRTTLGLAHGRHHEPGRIGLARAAAKPHLALPRLLVEHGAVDLRRQRLGTRLFQQKAQVLADDLVKVVVRAAAERLVHADDLLIGVHDDDALGRGLEHLGPQLQPLLHHFEHIDGRERGEHRIAPLELQAPRRQHGPGRLGGALPAHLELIDRALVRQALEEARPHAGLQPHGPWVGLAVTQPVGSRGVGVQHLVLGHRGDHHGDGEGLDQLALGLGRARAGGQLLL
ncbi:hypothetical protein D3C71_894000 [compost metagenome]